MLGRKMLLAVGAVVAGLLLPAPAMAQFKAVTDANLNLRVGPDVIYGVIDVIPYGDVVDVFGCIEEVEWCDVEWWGLRGWVSAHFLVHLETTVYLPQVYARIGVPIVSFSFSTYHDRYYRDRPWYKKRDGRWRGRDWRRGDRPKRHRGEKRWDAERPQQQHEVEPSQKQRKIERAKQKNQQQFQEAERPRKQREVKPSRQQRQIERANQKSQKQLQKAEQPRQGKQTQRPRQVQEAEQPRQGKRSKRQGQSGSGGPSEEMLNERGQ